MLPDAVRLVRRATGLAEERGLSPADAAAGVAAAFIAAAASCGGPQPFGPFSGYQVSEWLFDLANTADTAAKARKPT